MLWYCEFTWQPGTTYEQIADRLLAQQESIAAITDRIRGWYNLAGGGAGFLLIEVDDPRDLTAILQPWMDIVSWDVRAITETSLEQALANAREAKPNA
jgi:hypothetical protein